MTFFSLLFQLFLVANLMLLHKVSSYLARSSYARNFYRLKCWTGGREFSRGSETLLADASGSEIEENENPVFTLKQKYRELCHSSLLGEVLQKQNRFIATDIQSKSYQSIYDGKDVIVGAETGSGKTLAYFVPVIDKAIQRRLTLAATDSSSLRSGRGIILAPSGELCDQIVRMTQPLVKTLASEQQGLSILLERRAEKCLSWIPAPSSEPAGHSISNLFEFIVCTPKHLCDIIRSDDPYSIAHPLQDVDVVVLDEADMLLDGAYAKDVQAIVEHLKLIRRNKIRQKLIDVNRSTVQYILAAASLPTYGLKSIEKAAKRLFPLAKYIKTEYLHLHHPRIRQEYLPLTVEELETPSRLMEIILNKLQEVSSASPSSLEPFTPSSSPSSDPPVWLQQLSSSVMIFFNTAAKAEYFAELLTSQRKIPCVQMHSRLSKEERQEHLRAFLSQEKRVMVCTDSCARGLDLPFVKYVVQADFALNVVQHLHRVGRASRAGREGVAINYYHPDVSPLVDSIMGRQSYDMQVSEEDQEKPTSSSSPSAIERSFSRKRGFRKKFKKQQQQIKPLLTHS